MGGDRKWQGIEDLFNSTIRILQMHIKGYHGYNYMAIPPQCQFQSQRIRCKIRINGAESGIVLSSHISHRGITEKFIEEARAFRLSIVGGILQQFE